MKRLKPARTAPAIYVETHIDGSVDQVWAHTQTPQVHQRWDVRFSEISYLPLVPGEAQQFVYSTTVVPGFAVDGCGETLGERHRADGTAYSGLKFWSDHPLSLINEGAGYWRYVPTETGVRFLTRYDYRVRWGAFGRMVDRLVFRPIFGWGTAWSFDRLRLWIERGITPEQSRNQTIAHALSVLALAFAWIYHGLVPKLFVPQASELEMLESALGIGQALFGLAMLRWWRKRWPFVLTLAGLPLLALTALTFNSLTLNLALMALAGVALATRNGLPSGRAALRQAPRTSNQSSTSTTSNKSNKSEVLQ